MNENVNNTTVGGVNPQNVQPVVNPQVNTGVVNTQTTQVTSTVNSTSGVVGGQLLCDKCGTYYPSNQRYCMKCGALNYSHPDNQSMKQYMNYDVKNNSYVGNYKDKLSHNTLDPEIRRKKVCLFVSVILHLLCILGGVYLLNLLGVAKLGWPIVVCAVIFLILLVINYSMCVIYMHAGEEWWKYYIPIYGQIVYFKMTLDSGWMFLLSCIPIIGLIFLVMAAYRLGQRSGKNGWLTMLFFPIMVPVIAFTSDSYSGSLKSMHMHIDELDPNGKTESEKMYGTKKIFIIIIVLLVVGVIAYFNYQTIIDISKNLIDFLIDCYHDTIGIITDFINKYN